MELKESIRRVIWRGYGPLYIIAAIWYRRNRKPRDTVERKTKKVWEGMRKEECKLRKNENIREDLN